MADRNSTRVCVHCEKPFEVIRRRGPAPKYCSGRCRSKVARDRSAARPVKLPVRPRPPAPRTICQCEICNEPYLRPLNKDGSLRKSKHMCCSSRCRDIKSGRIQGLVGSARKCDWCLTEFQIKTGKQKFCSDSCRHADYRHHYEPSRGVNLECLVCGQEFRTHSPWAKTCGRKCKHEYNKAKPSYQRSRRVRDARRRARKRSGSADNIDPIAVFERDNWRCHLCGQKTLKGKRGTYHDRAPELEHIVALADGGSHTWGNVACACRRCNLQKGSESRGQLGFLLTG